VTTRSWIRKLFARQPRTIRKAPARCRPRLEALEDRLAPAVTDITPGHTETFTTIQQAVNFANPGDTIVADAGTYAEQVTINKSVTLLGANNTNPVPGRSGPESIVEPGLTSSFDTDSVFLVTANNVTIEGFTIQGSIASPPGGQSTGFTLTSGTTVYAAAGISNSSNVNNGGPPASSTSTTDISGLTVQNNIIKDFTQFGVYGDTSDDTVSTGNTIADNLISDVPNNGQGGYIGAGVIIYDNFYADITGNKLSNVRTGIQTGNNYLSSGTFVPSISNNIVSATVKGIYFSLQYESASPFTVSDNTITQYNGSVSPAYNAGLLIQSIQSSVQSVIQGNNISGFLYGVEFAGNNTTSSVTVEGGTLRNNTYGVWATNNDYFYPSNFDTTAALDGVTITNSTNAGVWVDSTSANSGGQFNTTNTVTLAVTDGTTITGGPVGLLVDGANSLASLTQSTITGNGIGVHVEAGGSLTAAQQNVITGNSGDGVLIDAAAGSVGSITDNNLSGNGGLGVNNKGSSVIDASTNWWGSKVLATVQAAISGGVDYTPFLDSGTDTQPAAPGFQGDFSVLDVTAASPQTGTIGRIQEGVNDVTAGGTVNVLAGTYAENVTIGQNLSLLGVPGSPTAVVINPTSGTGITVGSPATAVTIKGVEVTGAGTGISVSNLTTLILSDVTLMGNGTGGTVNNVTTLDWTPSSGSTGITATLTGTSFQRGSDNAVSFSNVPNITVFGSSGPDTFNVTPSASTTFTVHGGDPTPPATPGDVLIVNLSGTTNPHLNSTQPVPASGFAGSWTFGNADPIIFDQFETLSPTATLIVSQTASANPTEGGNVTFTVTVKNNGPGDATNVVLTDLVPVDSTFVSSSFTGYNSTTGQASLETIAANGSVTGTIVVQVPEERTISNTASVTTDTAQPDTSGNSSALLTLVADAALTAGTLTAPPNPVPGTPLSNLVLFHFSDADPNGTPSDYKATVTWGDGTVEDSVSNPSDVQVVASSSGGFDVVGAHTYLQGGLLSFGVAVVDQGSASTSKSGSVTVSTAAVVSGGPGDNTLILTRASGGPVGSVTYILNGGSPVTLSNLTSFTFNGGAGNDTLTVSLANGGPLVSKGPVAFDGGTGVNTLNLDAAGLPVRTIPGSFNAAGQAVNFSNTAATHVNNAAAIDAFAGPDTADRATAFTDLNAPERFVQVLYLDDLGRAGTKTEVDDWVNGQLKQPGGSPQAVAAAIAGSFEADDHLVQSWYFAFLGRQAQGGEELGWVKLLQSGQSEEQVLRQILGDPGHEFYDRAQTLGFGGTADQNFVQALYQVLLDRRASSSELDNAVAALKTMGPQGLALALLDSQEFRADQFAGYFATLLHRPADAGLANWVVSGLDAHGVRVAFESGMEFYNNG
jgi:uncharacterized repeat protein (TIGR01451 family)